MTELELTYLAKEIPADLDISTGVEMIDIYFPKEHPHPTLRLRKQGDKTVLTKKIPLTEGDASKQIEQTIVLNAQEFELFRQLPGKSIEKTRYTYQYNQHTGEIDVFKGALSGLVVIDFEFATDAQKDIFIPPAFCLVDVTQETFIAGGMLAGKSYTDIEINLAKYGYRKLKV